jgi:hypothetical protein
VVCHRHHHPAEHVDRFNKQFIPENTGKINAAITITMIKIFVSIFAGQFGY